MLLGSISTSFLTFLYGFNVTFDAGLKRLRKLDDTISLIGMDDAAAQET